LVGVKIKIDETIERQVRALTMDASTVHSAMIHPGKVRSRVLMDGQDRMRVNIQHIELYHVPSKPIMVRLAFRRENVKTASMPIQSKDFDKHSFEFPLTYHSILFDKLKVEVLESKLLFGNTGIGRCHIKLSKLSSLLGECCETFELKLKHHHLNPLHHSAVLGKITLKFVFYGGPMDQIIPPILTHFDEPIVCDSPSSTPSDEFLRYLEEAEMEHTKPGISPLFMRPRMDSISSVSSTASTLTNCTSGSDRKFSNRNGKIITERTKLGLKEIADVYTTVIGFNSPISKPDMAKALVFLVKFFERHPRRYSLVHRAHCLLDLPMH
jgi:hypothetical protein